MVCDAGSNTVWTGHADGTIRVHYIKDAATDAAAPEWNVATATCCNDVAVSCLAIQVQDQAASPRCWAGCAQGRIFVYQLTWMGNKQQLLHKKTGRSRCQPAAWTTRCWVWQGMPCNSTGVPLGEAPLLMVPAWRRRHTHHSVPSHSTVALAAMCVVAACRQQLVQTCEQHNVYLPLVMTNTCMDALAFVQFRLGCFR
jgi:hypothetical protein